MPGSGEASGASATKPAEPVASRPKVSKPAAPKVDDGSGDGAAPTERQEITPEEVYALRGALGLMPPAPLVVGDLLTRADVRELTGYTGTLSETTLDGIPATDSYNTIRLASETPLGAVLQLWRLDEARKVTPKYNRLRETYITSTVDAEPAGDAAFVSEFGDVRGYVFMHRASRSVGVVSCDFKMCDAAQLKALAARVVSRL